MRVAAFSLVVVLSGCFSYARTETDALPASTEVVVTLSAPLDVRIEEITVHGVTLLEGRVAYADADSVVLSGTRFHTETGMDYPSFGSPVTLPRSAIEALKRKRVSGWKTALALSAGGAAIAAIVASVDALGGSGGGGRPKPQP